MGIIRSGADVAITGSDSPRHHSPGADYACTPGTRHSALGTRHSALGTWHSALGTRHSALGTARRDSLRSAKPVRRRRSPSHLTDGRTGATPVPAPTPL